MFVITEKLLLTDTEEVVEWERKMEKMARMGLQWRVGLGRSLALKVSSCAAGLRLEVWR